MVYGKDDFGAFSAGAEESHTMHIYLVLALLRLYTMKWENKWGKEIGTCLYVLYATTIIFFSFFFLC